MLGVETGGKGEVVATATLCLFPYYPGICSLGISPYRDLTSPCRVQWQCRAEDRKSQCCVSCIKTKQFKDNWAINCILKLVVCILLRVLGQVQGFRLTQHCFE
jgi:hypothetical protein